MKNNLNTICCSLLLSCLIINSTAIGQIQGKTLLLDGTNDYVEVPDNNSLDITANMTIEAWVNPCSYAAYTAIATKQWCNSEVSYYFGLRNGYLEWAWTDDGTCANICVYRASSAQLNLNQWAHVAAVHTASGVALYVNGSQVTASLISGSYSAIYSGNQPVRIGTYRALSGSLTTFFDGRIDDVRIWNAALTQTNIQNRRNMALVGNESNLVAYYPMEITGSGQNITVTNAATATGATLNGTTKGTVTTPGFISTTIDFNNLALGNDTILPCNQNFILNTDSSGVTYSWQNGSTASTFTVTSSGTYWVDAVIGSCVVRDTIIIDFGPTVNAIQTSIPCGSNGNGSALATVSGGSGNYVYSWTPGGQTTQSVSGLSSGSYSIQVTDNSGGCITIATLTITAFPSVTAVVSHTNVACSGGTGAASVNVTTGTPAYTYSWSTNPIQAGVLATGLGANTFTVLITDAAGCTSTPTVSIAQSGSLISFTTSSTNTTIGSSSGTASVVATGGSPGYTYSWSMGATTQNVTGLAAGSYTVCITDSYGCDTCSVILIQEFDPSGISKSLNKYNIHVYPNPFHSQIAIDFRQMNKNKVHLQVLNIIGEPVYSEEFYISKGSEKLIDTSSMANGIYIISIAINSDTYFTKMIKN